MIVAVVVALLCCVAALVFWLRRHVALFSGPANLPPVHVKQQPSGKAPKVRDSKAVLSSRPPVILYGTTTGTSQRLAERLSTVASDLFDLKLACVSLDDYEFDDLPKEPIALFILPTYEGGTPNELCKVFFDLLMDAAQDFRFGASYLDKTHFSVFGLGDTAYGDNYCAVARKVDDSLKKLGGHRILARGAGDGQYTEQQFEAWMKRLWPSLLACLGMKSKLAELRETMRSAKKKAEGQAYVSDEDDDQKDGEPLDDVEDLAKGKKSKSKASNNSNSNNNNDNDIDNVDSEDDEEEEGEDNDDNDAAEGGGGQRKQLITPALSAALTKQGYQLIGSHSGVKLCRWTKAMLRGRGGCYKHTFYNITSYQCMEMTPSLACANKCVFCWRHHKNPVAKEWKWEMDKPEFLIEQSIEKHRNMIKQCKGVPGVVPERYEEAFTVRHCALSLVGEPIIYPEINRFVDMLHERQISSFMVTNAQFPKEIEQLKPVTQLYLSIDAATPESLKKIDRPVFPDFWERFLASIDALRRKGQRTVFRLTLVKEWNMEEIEGYAELIRRGLPDFVEVKGVTYCGNSKASTLTIKNTPYHEEVEGWVRRLCEAANAAVGVPDQYELACEHQHSVCFLIANKKKFHLNNEWYTWIDYDRFHQLVKEGRPFTAEDYVAKTAPWALVGSRERGFDPEDQRHMRTGKNKKEYENQGC